MGELRGGRPDQPEEQPEPRRTPAPTGDRPSPAPDSNNNPEAIRRAMRASDAFADRPTHRAPDIEPPSGTELQEKDAPEASRGARFRKRLGEKLEDSHDSLDQVGEIISGVARNAPGHSEVRTPKPVIENPTPHGIEGGQVLTGAFVAGILLGEGVRRAYRRAHS